MAARPAGRIQRPGHRPVQVSAAPLLRGHQRAIAIRRRRPPRYPNLTHTTHHSARPLPGGFSCTSTAGLWLPVAQGNQDTRELAALLTDPTLSRARITRMDALYLPRGLGIAPAA